MRTILTLFIVLVSIGHITTTDASIPAPVQSFAALPHQFLESKIQEIQEAFEQRSVLFLKGRNFKSWSNNKSKENILKEFDQINEWRFHAWYVDPYAKILISRADFMVAQDLLEKGYFRKPNTIAFQYNQSDATYNSSTIVLNGFRFLALEAPSAKNVKSFFTLLQNHHITHLVRLTTATEKGIEKSYPYWKDKLKTDAKNQESLLNIPQAFNPSPYPVRYYYTDKWLDDQAIDPKELLKLIQATRKNYDPDSDILACHCTNGVGRTGTFLAGFLLITEIDKQIAAGVSKNSLNISIEKIVMQLSLQRPYMVGKPEQYTTLYRLVDLYIQQLK
jgi:protein tyrosine phosphatase